jgi:hypothetical protein
MSKEGVCRFIDACDESVVCISGHIARLCDKTGTYLEELLLMDRALEPKASVCLSFSHRRRLPASDNQSEPAALNCSAEWTGSPTSVAIPQLRRVSSRVNSRPARGHLNSTPRQRRRVVGTSRTSAIGTYHLP